MLGNFKCTFGKSEKLNNKLGKQTNEFSNYLD
jgi:hypothetical protein